MSLERVQAFIVRHEEQTTFVFSQMIVVMGVKKCVARCIAANNLKAEQKINRIMLGFYANLKPVGCYTADVNEDDLAQDLKYCGVET